MDNILFKSKGSLIKDNGTLADLSKKVTLYLNELSDDQIINLNRLVRNQSVDILIFPSGDLEKYQELFNEAKMILDKNNTDNNSLELLKNNIQDETEDV